MKHLLVLGLWELRKEEQHFATLRAGKMPLNTAGSQGGVGSSCRDPSSSQLLVPGKRSWKAEVWEAKLGHYRHLVAYSCHGRVRGRKPRGAKGEQRTPVGGGVGLGDLSLPEELTRPGHRWKGLPPGEGELPDPGVCKQGALGRA